MFSALLVGGSAQADPPVAQSNVVSAVPQTNTPDVQNGVVYAISSLGTKMFLGGTFTSIGEHGSVNVVTRNYIAAFDAGTGKIDQGFVPAVNGEVDAIAPGPGNSVYIAGKFTTVNGASTRVDLLDATTGQRVAGWTPPVLNGITQTLTTVGGNLYIGGAFTSATSGGQQTVHKGLVEVNGSTGAVVKTMTVQLTGRHGTGSRQGPLGPKKLAVSPDGTEMVVIGNFTDAADSTTAPLQHNDQVVRLNLTSTTATVQSNWSTAKYSAQCANNAFDSYIRDVQFSPDGSYFVIVATGGGTFSSNVDGSRSLCDTAARWETNGTGSNVQPTWVDYTGNDTFWSVAVTGSAVYAGGHQRWVNNTTASDSAGEGAVPRPGIVALDPVNGMPLAWNPGRNPRGAGAYVVYATSTGIWVGSDTDWIGNRKYKHMKVAFFPLAGGYAVEPRILGTLPGNVYEVAPLVKLHPEVYGDSVISRSLDGSGNVGSTTTVDTITMDWTQVRGAFMVDNWMYYGMPGGTFWKRMFDGSTFGPAIRIDPYDDPLWSNVNNGSGGTYQGVVSDYYGQVSNASSAFYFDGRLYYTLARDSHMYYRYFSPDQGGSDPASKYGDVIGCDEFTVNDGGIDWSNVAGAFVTGNTLYFVTKSDGVLRRIAWSTDHATGSSTVVDSTNNWASHGLFLH
jgi:hypothetical protein